MHAGVFIALYPESYSISGDRPAPVPDAASLTVFPPSIESGPHPFPFRTRKLSPTSAMVLPGCPGGRVARRWDLFGRRQTRHAAGAVFVFVRSFSRDRARHYGGIRSANRVADGAALGCEAGGRCQPSWPSEIWRKGLSARSC